MHFEPRAMTWKCQAVILGGDWIWTLFGISLLRLQNAEATGLKMLFLEMIFLRWPQTNSQYLYCYSYFLSLPDPWYFGWF